MVSLTDRGDQLLHALEMIVERPLGDTRRLHYGVRCEGPPEAVQQVELGGFQRWPCPELPSRASLSSDLRPAG